MPFPLLWVLGAVIVGAAAVSLCWSDISAWLSSKKKNKNDYGQLVREKLANGDVKVIGGVFNSKNELIASEEWTGSETSEIRSMFKHKNKIKLEI